MRIFVGLIINYITKKIIVIYFTNVYLRLEMYTNASSSMLGSLREDKILLDNSLDSDTQTPIRRQTFNNFIQMLKECLREIIPYFTNPNLPIARDILRNIDDIQNKLDEINTTDYKNYYKKP